MPKETSLQEGEREEEGAQEGSEGLGPSSLGPPESRDGVLMSASPGPFAGRGLCPTPEHWHIGKCRETDTDADMETRGGPDFQEITMACQARGRCLLMKNLLAPTQVELFPSIFLALPYSPQPRAGVS